MRVLVTGGTGFIGRHLTTFLLDRGFTVVYTVHETNCDFAGIPYTTVDITNSSAVNQAVEWVNPDVVVHTAALADADECERSPERAQRVNVEGTENVIRACERTDSKLVFVSSSFVFSGAENPYAEEDWRDPVNMYGRTKTRAEDAVTSSSLDSLVVRTDQPYGWPQHWQPPTMVTWLLKQLSGQGSVSVFGDWYNNPVHVRDFCRGVALLLKCEYTGVYHVVGDEFISRYEWALEIASAFGYPRERIVSTSATESDLPATRPNAELSNQKLAASSGWSPRSLGTVLREMATTLDS